MKSRKKHYGMVVNTKACVGCGACVVACKTENEVPEGLHRDWVVEELSGTYPDLNLEIRSERCNHCSNAPCVQACPTGASHQKKGTNLVKVTSNKCSGCRACMAACPYNARFVMPQGYISKCTFCDHRLEVGKDTACATVCPSKAITIGDLNNPQSEVSKLLRKNKWKVVVPEAGTKPNVYYLV